MITIKKKDLLSLIILMVFILSVNVEGKTSFSEDLVQMDSSSYSDDNYLDSLTPHGYISITSDGAFASAGFAGNGSLADPYIIENYNITVTAEWGIIIRDTSVFFIIRNNYIDADSAGISLINVGSGRARVEDNIIAKHRYRGIDLYNAPDSYIENNTVYDAEIEGIKLVLSPGTTLKDNKCYNCGFYYQENSLVNYLSYIFLGTNWVNDKPLGYIKNPINTDFADVAWGQIYFINATNVGLYDMNLYNVSYGFMGLYSTQIVLENCTFSNNTEYGAAFIECSESDVIECTFSNNEYGFYSSYSSNIEVADSTFLYNKEGLYFDTVTGALIRNSIFDMNKWEGMLLQSVTDLVISNNYIANVSYSALYITECINIEVENNYIELAEEAGIYTYYSWNFNVSNNVLLNNYWGIYWEEVSQGLVTYNVFQNSTSYGVFLDGDCANNKIYLNSFSMNNGNTEQAFDDGASDFWYDEASQTGNWWSDHVSGNYSIPGFAGSYDLYPLSTPPVTIIPEFQSSAWLSLILLISMSFVSFLVFRKKL